MPAPAPITFPYDEATVTATGRKQAAALSDFLRQRKLDVVTLSGHADERGSDEYNMQLSRNRLESVARYLRDTGYAGKLVLLPKGKSEPVHRRRPRQALEGRRIPARPACRAAPGALICAAHCLYDNKESRIHA